jgi:hypothetical protein
LCGASLRHSPSIRLNSVRRFRQIAYAIVFGGWMLPAYLAQAAGARAPKTAPDTRTPFEVMAGVAPTPAPAEQAASLFNAIAFVWFLMALLYAAVLAIRLRRGLVR